MSERDGRPTGVSGLNPKGRLLLLAILPQFARSGAAWVIAIQLAAVTTRAAGVAMILVGITLLAARVA